LRQVLEVSRDIWCTWKEVCMSCANILSLYIKDLNILRFWYL
jgi:hypothetical protein